MRTKIKELKGRVASFRVSQRVDDDIEKAIKANYVKGIDSANQFYRKLALDWHAGRLVYKDPSHRNHTAATNDADDIVRAALLSAETA